MSSNQSSCFISDSRTCRTSSPKDMVFLIGSGQSNSLQRSDKNNLKGKRTLSNVLVEISNGREIVRENTNKKGEFCFKNIRPGKWTLKFYGYNLPANHYSYNPNKNKKIMNHVIYSIGLL